MNEEICNVEQLVNPCEKMKAGRDQRRWSERIQNQIIDKDVQGKKRSLEGTSQSNSFSALSSCTILDKSNNMGVHLDTLNFDAITMLTELEKARAELHKKHSTSSTQDGNNNNASSSTMINNEDIVPSNEVGMEESSSLPVQISNDQNSDVDLLSWIDEETSDLEDFIIVTPKRCRKPNKRFSFSGTKKPKKSNKEIPCFTHSGGVAAQGIPAPAKPLSKKKKKKTS